ncbi:hypothetical protein F4804DRAFT_257128 [Jackrogersella minutella]|nr:hypothetical protein F4804DRAFT_257128 [Jackrogersella minutella]
MWRELRCDRLHRTRSRGRFLGFTHVGLSCQYPYITFLFLPFFNTKSAVVELGPRPKLKKPGLLLLLSVSIVLSINGASGPSRSSLCTAHTLLTPAFLT